MGVAGKEAYKAGKFALAAQRFTEGIEDISVDVDQLHVLHSNRCACYMQLAQFDKAFDDAEACTTHKPTWAKGWSRRGAALQAQRKWREAIVCFEKAAELEPADALGHTSDAAKCREKLERAEQQAAYRAAAAAAGRAGAAPQPVMELMHLALRIALFFYAIVYLCTWSADRGVLSQRYKSVVRLFVLSMLVNAFRTHGRPKLSKDFAQQMMCDVAVQRLFGGVVLLMGSSFPPLLAPLYFEMANTAALLVARLKGHSATRGIALRIMAVCEGSLLNENGDVDWQVSWNCGYLELGAGLLAILELASPRRNLVMLLLYWQYLQMRYMLETATQQVTGTGAMHNAFEQLDTRLSKFFAGPKCPTALEKVYDKAKALAKSQVALPEPGKKAGLKCTVM